ncbi:AlpA family transcriptional regulator [Curtobacterium sp. ISL-83]|uniref:helix-turn-helix transcriptional regulator n=1 Tax=Curtobacterium sp. ISL-83 TaxID=2819145 RepID=UPI001BE68C08|nr:hypothetical protein [Curtobacterium sp. ISL-83]MBT2501428.1 hypothetical protein [Curtobacterium sp. ISL-83]
MEDISISERALDVHGLASWLGISTDKAYQLGNDPLFPSFRVGNRHRFWPSEVKAWTQQPRDAWKQSARSLGRKRKRDGDAPSQLRRMRS